MTNGKYCNLMCVIFSQSVVNFTFLNLCAIIPPINEQYIRVNQNQS
jgi:hypothetical protein